MPPKSKEYSLSPMNPGVNRFVATQEQCCINVLSCINVLCIYMGLNNNIE